MKKTFSIITALFFILGVSAKAEIGVGITGALHSFDGDGTETTRTSGQVNNGTHSEEVMVPEVFVEAIADSGVKFGVSYIPTRDLGSQSRSDTNSEGDTGTYKAAAELDNVIQVYTDIPVANNFHVKLGIQRVTLISLESLNSGSSYPDADLFGATIGLGYSGDIPYGNNLYYKAEVTYTNFETYEESSSGNSSGNKVSADLEDTAAKLSIGYKF